MNSSANDAWIYVSNCPICQCGLRRVRACAGPAEHPHLHGYVLCDDCETVWREPDVRSEHIFPDVETAACPVCREPLYGSQARWATEAEIVALGWREQCIVEPAHRLSIDEDLLEPEDFATDLDAPEPPETHDQELVGHNISPAEQLAEVTPQIDGAEDESSEPKPGC
jgi:hypothetical protein